MHSKLAQMVKNPPAMQDMWVWSLGRYPGEGNGYPLQCSCLENSTDRAAWWATVHRVAKSRHYWATKRACNISLCCFASFPPTMLPHQQVMLRSAQGIGGFQFTKLHWLVFSLFPILSHFSEHFLWQWGPQQLPCPLDGQSSQLILQFHYAWVY